MYRFTLPDSFFTRTANKVLLYALREHREWFYDDFVIESVFGCPSNSVWNGGRSLHAVGEIFIPPLMYKNVIVGMYKNFGVSYRFTFTNQVLQPFHLYDAYSNKLASLMNAENDFKAIVNMPMMADFLKSRYQSAQITWSTTCDFGKTIEEQIDKVNELSAKDTVVVPYTFNNKPEIIDKLKHPENIELLANEVCIDNCPNRARHYRSLSLMNIYDVSNVEDFTNVNCTMVNVIPEEKWKEPRLHHIGRDLLKEYAAKGFNLFKLEGRNDGDVNLLNRYLEYFLIPECAGNLQNFYNECMQTNFSRFEHPVQVKDMAYANNIGGKVS